MTAFRVRPLALALLGAPTALWGRLSRFWRHFLIECVIGLCVEGVIHHFHSSPLVSVPENAAFDWMMDLVGRTRPDTASGEHVAFTLLDIDDETVAAWGNPIITPRDRIRHLIDYAVQGGARAVVVDILMTKRADELGSRHAAADSALRTHLAALDSPTPVILVRDVVASRTSGFVERPSFLEIGIEPKVQWGSVRYTQETDGTVRRWQLWEQTCRDGKPAVVPSVQLLTASLIDPKVGAARLKSWLDAHASATCELPVSESSGGASAETGVDHDAKPALEEELVINGHTIEWTSEPLAQRIFFTMPWHAADSSHDRAMVKLPDGTVAPNLDIVSARVPADTTRPVSGDLVRGRVVIIGGSDADDGDIYTTPLGLMPGALIIANSIASLNDHGQFGEAPRWLELTVLIGGVLVMSAFFARFHHFIAAICVAVILLVLTMLASFYLFRDAVWLSFAIPLLAVEVHNIIAQASEWAEQRGEGSHHSHGEGGDHEHAS